MQNHLYFLPSVTESNQKKAFFLFEYAHAGFFKSDQVSTTDRAFGISQCALDGSKRSIVIDTSTESGRNLLHRVLPLVKEGRTDRILLASIFRQYPKAIQEYWEKWGEMSPEERKYRDDHFVKYFGTARTLGGMRSLTACDLLTIRAWQHTALDSLEPSLAEDLLQHPVALFLRALILAFREVSKQAAAQPLEECEATIAAITHCVCRLIQDPFPLQTTNGYSQLCFCLFDGVSKDYDSSPENIIFRVVKGEGKERDTLKKESHGLWLLIVQMRKLLDGVTGNMSRNGVSLGGVFRCQCPFENRMIQLFDQMLHTWAAMLLRDQPIPVLEFIDHELFSDRFASTVRKHCKALLEV